MTKVRIFFEKTKNIFYKFKNFIDKMKYFYNKQIKKALLMTEVPFLPGFEISFVKNTLIVAVFGSSFLVRVLWIKKDLN